MMSTYEDWIRDLTDPDDKKAYESLKKLEEISGESPALYPFLDTFLAMLKSDRSYVRTRGLVLVAANAKWDEEDQIDRDLDLFLRCVGDDKPITARQCIRLLPGLVKDKPALKDRVVEALGQADLSNYKESMQTLIARDIEASLQEIDHQ